MFDKIKRTASASVKITVIGFMILMLMIPTLFIRGLISDREMSRSDAVHDVSAKWGMAQTLEGPIVTVPYLKWPKADKTIPENVDYVYLLPENLNIDGKLLPEVRSRGIFDVPLYTADLKVTGTFSKNGSSIPIPANQMLWQDAKISLGVSDIRGLREQVKVKFDNADLTLKSGLSSRDILTSGVGSGLSGFGDKETHDFSFHLMLNGSENLEFVPTGKETKVQLSSSWQNPSFDGNFLPTERTLDKDGFKASWSVLDVNRNYPQVWFQEKYETQSSKFGVSLFTPVDQYQQVTRSVKYAILFITLTFLSFFLVEVMNRFSIHPIQYLLVGFAMVLFYLLLLSLSEQIGFNLSYLIASVATVGMVSLYSGSVLRIKKLGNLIGLLLAVLYIFLYVLLQMEDFALILGSVGLFIILSAVMYLTRNIDWYNMKSE